MKHWIFVLALLSPPAAIAQECRYDGSQLEMNACAKRDFKQADLAMTQAYASRMKRQFKKDQTVLLNEQTAWLQRRSARCKFNPDNGSNAIIEYYTCMQSMTEVRTLMLLRR